MALGSFLSSTCCPFSLCFCLSVSGFSQPTAPPILGVDEMALVGCWPSVHPEAWVVLPRSVQLGREGGHLGPPAWCPHVGSPAGEPWESQLPGTLNPFDCGFLRVPAVLAAPPTAQGDLSNTARPPGTKDKARGSTTHTNVHTRPHTSAQTTPTSTLGHTLPGHLHRPLAGTQIPMQSIAATRLCADRPMSAGTHAHAHPRRPFPHPSPLRPSRFHLGCSRLLETRRSHRSARSSLGRDARPGPGGGSRRSGHTLPGELLRGPLCDPRRPLTPPPPPGVECLDPTVGA